MNGTESSARDSLTFDDALRRVFDRLDPTHPNGGTSPWH